MEKQLAENIIKAWCKMMNKDMPPKYELDVSCPPYTILTVPNGEYVTFTIEEKRGYYQIGVLPTHTITVNIDEPFFGLQEEDIQDYEGYVDSLYDDMANSPIPQWVRKIPMDPPSIRSSNEMIIEGHLEEWMTLTGIDSDQIVFWFVNEIVLPTFLGQTAKHMAKSFIDGIESYNIEDVYQYWAQRMGGGESIESLLDEVKVYCEGVNNA